MTENIYTLDQAESHASISIVRVRHCTVGELAEMFDEWMIDDKALGFTVGRGKKIHWFLSPSPSGFYYVYPSEPPEVSISGLGYRRALEVDHKVTVHYAL